MVTASKLLAETALGEGKYFQGMPDYGAERMGAPITAYTRIGPEPIRPYCMVTEPDGVVVLDHSLLGVVDVTGGMKRRGKLIVNTPISPKEIRSKVKFKGEIWAVDATKISMEVLKRNIPNTPMLGALARAVGIVNKKSLIKQFKEKFGSKLKAEIVDANIVALEKAYDGVRKG